MNIIQEVVLSFALALGWGNYCWRPLVKPELTGAGFYKLVNIISFVSTLISVGFCYWKGSHFAALSFCMAAILLIYQHRFQKDFTTTKQKGLWALVVLLFAFGSSFLYSGYAFLFFFISALYFGLTHYLMILGHYYLVVPKLSEKPLLRGSYILWILFLIKILLAIKGYLAAGTMFQQGSSLGLGYLFNWLLLSMRFFWGYLALIVLSFLAYRCARIRSTQSATGIFYIMLFFVIIGELLSYYLWHELGVFL